MAHTDGRWKVPRSGSVLKLTWKVPHPHLAFFARWGWGFSDLEDNSRHLWP
jgi:hypothetical protein